MKSFARHSCTSFDLHTLCCLPSLTFPSGTAGALQLVDSQGRRSLLMASFTGMVSKQTGKTDEMKRRDIRGKAKDSGSPMGLPTCTAEVHCQNALPKSIAKVHCRSPLPKCTALHQHEFCVSESERPLFIVRLLFLSSCHPLRVLLGSFGPFIPHRSWLSTPHLPSIAGTFHASSVTHVRTPSAATPRSCALSHRHDCVSGGSGHCQPDRL